ncbi:tRNA (guanosine(37)-N1)-methyltransferase TrmD [Candidatus Peregrinibacteria bacterium]|nr:MAG: tRNA (guanosine(37)-N1)-methyltransferase TrmD [Candidatus Peregrinibacteria bacterium]
MRFDILTLFPKLVQPYFEDSILKRAIEAGHITVAVHNIRDYSKERHHKVDDTPYGGGSGMLMACQPLYDAIKAIKKLNTGPVLYMSPVGQRFTQKKALELAESGLAARKNSKKGLILLCGRYEGIDERIIELLVDEEISIGDFVLTGGELPALTIVDAVARLLPGVLGDEQSAHEESFSDALEGMLEYPHYTKPESFKGKKVPPVLLSGNHAEIAKWRRAHRRHPHS